MRKTTGVSESEHLWKAAAQAALIGIAGAVAMLATEMMLFPGLVRADGVAVSCCASSATVAFANAGANAGR